MTILVYEQFPKQETLETTLVDVKKDKLGYLYELAETIFYVEGGGQLKDEGTINNESVLACIEEAGHIYHRTAKPIINTDKIILSVDLENRWISRQGHTAQHLISAGFYELYALKTISHHYDERGSYIDLDTVEISEEMLQNVEKWVNEKIHEAHAVEIFYPNPEQLVKLPIHHEIHTDKDIRIVHIHGVEYNPCKGLHVTNTAEVGALVILEYEHVKKKIRIHYMFGEVAISHLHTYYEQLKKISVAVSKPLTKAYDGLCQMEKQIQTMEEKYYCLCDAYINDKLTQAQAEAGSHYIVAYLPLDASLVSRLTHVLSSLENEYGYIVTASQILAFAGKQSGQDAKVLFQKAAKDFEIKGGGHSQLCRGGLPKVTSAETLIEKIKTWCF